MLGEIIGAVGSIVGGLAGGDTSTNSREKSKTRSKSSTTTRSHLGQMVRQAEKHGFNPLTVLQSGGLSAYATSQNKGFSNTRSRSHGSSSSSAPFGQAIAGAAQAIGGAVAQSEGTQAASTARDAWLGMRSPTPYGDPIINRQNDMSLVMQQLGGNSGANAVTPSGGNPQIPTSSVQYQGVPSLSLSTDPNKVTPSTFNFDFLNPYAPGGAPKGVGWLDAKVEQNEVLNWQPKPLTDRGYRIPGWVAPASAWEEWFGESELLQQGAALINMGAYAWHNRDLIKRDTGLIGQSVAEQAKSEFNTMMDEPLLSQTTYDDKGNKVGTLDLFPSPNYIASETQSALKRIAPDPALAAASGEATRRRQYMEMQGVTW